MPTFLGKMVLGLTEKLRTVEGVVIEEHDDRLIIEDIYGNGEYIYTIPTNLSNRPPLILPESSFDEEVLGRIAAIRAKHGIPDPTSLPE